jgi:hypothetical protein
MYLVLLFFLLFFTVTFFYLNTQEGFTTDFQVILPIEITDDNKSISVPNNIKGNNIEVNPYIAFEGDIRIKKENCIEFAKGQKTNAESVKIGHNNDSLYIKGVGNDSTNLNISLQSIVNITKKLTVAESIQCQTINITSDERVKHKKSTLSSKTSLDKVRALIPTQFQYKNETASGTQPVYGFIAQEVQNVLPTCVSSQKSYISNIYDTATLNNRLLTFKHFKTSDLAYKGTTLYPKLKLRINDQDEYVTIVRIVDEETVEIEDKKLEIEDKKLKIEDEKLEIEDEKLKIENEVLVYGQEVDDFLTIDKNQLFTLSTSALQEVDRQLQEERENNKTTFHRILQRLSNLEAK